MSYLTTSRITLIALALGCGVAGCSIVRDPERIARETHRERSTLADFLSNGQASPASDARVDLELPIRIGLAFLPPAGNVSEAVPTAEQRTATLMGARAAMMSLPYVSEVCIVPDYYLEPGAAGGFEKLRELSRRFDLDLLAVLSSDQASYETRNLHSLGLITVIGAGLWEGDVDEAVTVIELAIVEPESPTVIMRVASAAASASGDTTSLLDDWRSNKHARRVSFDEARKALNLDLPQNLGGLLTRIQPATGERP